MNIPRLLAGNPIVDYVNLIFIKLIKNGKVLLWFRRYRSSYY